MLGRYDLRRTTAAGTRVGRRSPVTHSEAQGPDSGLCMVPVQGLMTEASGQAQRYNRYYQPGHDARSVARPAQARDAAPRSARAVGGTVYGEMYPPLSPSFQEAHGLSATPGAQIDGEYMTAAPPSRMTRAVFNHHHIAASRAHDARGAGHL